MKKPTLRLGMSLIITISIWAPRVSAQPAPSGQPYLPGYVCPEPLQLLVVPPVPYIPAYHPPYPMPFVPPQIPSPSPYCARRMLNSHGMGCQANDEGVGNFASEMRFIFGSSRWFFNEVCVPGQPCFRSAVPQR